MASRKFLGEMDPSLPGDRWITSVMSQDAEEQGPVSLTVFRSQFKFVGNFVSLRSRFWYSDRYKILYMARQLCCRGMCKNLLRSDGQQRNYSKAKFPSNMNCGQKIVSETGLWFASWVIRTKSILNSNLVESRSSTSAIIFQNFEIETIQILLCPVQIFKWSSKWKITYSQTGFHEIWVCSIYQTDFVIVLQ